jgi:AbrB family looped-hinge helix DNA binding protein
VSNIGIIKEFDSLGRIVIPKELRARYGLDSDVEIIATKEGVLLTSPKYRLVKKEAPEIKKTDSIL